MTKARKCKTTNHLAERFPRLFASQQESSAAFEQDGKVVDVCAMEVVQANLEHVQDDMRRDNPELRQVRDEGQILQSNFGQLNDNLLLALEVPKLFIQLQFALSKTRAHANREAYKGNDVLSDVWHILVQGRYESGIVR